jgi:hypothetical protein
LGSAAVSHNPIRLSKSLHDKFIKPPAIPAG